MSLERAADFWDREVVNPTHVTWMGHPLVREYINGLVGGDSPGWPMDWFAGILKGRRFQRALSVGCGAGALERDLINHNVCDRIDAFDGSPSSIQLAREAAEKGGMSSRLNYFVGDFNEPHLAEGPYDAVFFHQSAHHVAELETLFRAVLRVLTPDGIVYLDEYIGPSRTDWDDRLISTARAVYRMIPAGCAKESLALPIQPDDPSEAIRSAEILPQLKIGFTIEHFRGYGGNLLSVIFPSLRSAPDILVEQLIAAERDLLSSGTDHYHAVIVARPKRGLAALAASGRYSFALKMRRRMLERRQRLARESAGTRKKSTS